MRQDLLDGYLYASSQGIKNLVLERLRFLRAEHIQARCCQQRLRLRRSSAAYSCKDCIVAHAQACARTHIYTTTTIFVTACRVGLQIRNRSCQKYVAELMRCALNGWRAVFAVRIHLLGLLETSNPKRATQAVGFGPNRPILACGSRHLASASSNYPLLACGSRDLAGLREP